MRDNSYNQYRPNSHFQIERHNQNYTLGHNPFDGYPYPHAIHPQDFQTSIRGERGTKTEPRPREGFLGRLWKRIFGGNENLPPTDKEETLQREVRLERIGAPPIPPDLRRNLQKEFKGILSTPHAVDEIQKNPIQEENNTAKRQLTPSFHIEEVPPRRMIDQNIQTGLSISKPQGLIPPLARVPPEIEKNVNNVYKRVKRGRPMDREEEMMTDILPPKRSKMGVEYNYVETVTLPPMHQQVPMPSNMQPTSITHPRFGAIPVPMASPVPARGGIRTPKQDEIHNEMLIKDANRRKRRTARPTYGPLLQQNVRVTDLNINTQEERTHRLALQERARIAEQCRTVVREQLPTLVYQRVDDRVDERFDERFPQQFDERLGKQFPEMLWGHIKDNKLLVGERESTRESEDKRVAESRSKEEEKEGIPQAIMNGRLPAATTSIFPISTPSGGAPPEVDLPHSEPPETTTQLPTIIKKGEERKGEIPTSTVISTDKIAATPALPPLPTRTFTAEDFLEDEGFLSSGQEEEEPVFPHVPSLKKPGTLKKRKSMYQREKETEESKREKNSCIGNPASDIVSKDKNIGVNIFGLQSTGKTNSISTPILPKEERKEGKDGGRVSTGMKSSIFGENKGGFVQGTSSSGGNNASNISNTNNTSNTSNIFQTNKEATTGSALSILPNKPTTSLIQPTLTNHQENHNLTNPQTTPPPIATSTSTTTSTNNIFQVPPKPSTTTTTTTTRSTEIAPVSSTATIIFGTGGRSTSASGSTYNLGELNKKDENILANQPNNPFLNLTRQPGAVQFGASATNTPQNIPIGSNVFGNVQGQPKIDTPSFPNPTSSNRSSVGQAWESNISGNGRGGVLGGQGRSNMLFGSGSQYSSLTGGKVVSTSTMGGATNQVTSDASNMMETAQPEAMTDMTDFNPPSVGPPPPTWGNRGFAGQEATVSARNLFPPTETRTAQNSSLHLNPHMGLGGTQWGTPNQPTNPGVSNSVGLWPGPSSNNQRPTGATAQTTSSWTVNPFEGGGRSNSNQESDIFTMGSSLARGARSGGRTIYRANRNSTSDAIKNWHREREERESSNTRDNEASNPEDELWGDEDMGDETRRERAHHLHENEEDDWSRRERPNWKEGKDWEAEKIPSKLECMAECLPICEMELAKDEEEVGDDIIEEIIESAIDCGIECGAKCVPEAFLALTSLFEDVGDCYESCVHVECPAYCAQTMGEETDTCKEACDFGCMFCEDEEGEDDGGD